MNSIQASQIMGGNGAKARKAADLYPTPPEVTVALMRFLKRRSGKSNGGVGIVETLNCMRCKYRHEDNGNCTAVGGFCTAVTAAHCPLLRDFLDAGLTPAEVHSMSGEWGAMMSVLNGIGSYDRLRELAEADKAGRLVVLPCKVGDIVWANLDGMRHPRKCVIEFVNIGSHVTTIVFSTVDGLREQYGVNPSSFGKTVFLTSEEAEKALEGKRNA